MLNYLNYLYATNNEDLQYFAHDIDRRETILWDLGCLVCDECTPEEDGKKLLKEVLERLGDDYYVEDAFIDLLYIVNQSYFEYVIDNVKYGTDEEYDDFWDNFVDEYFVYACFSEAHAADFMNKVSKTLDNLYYSGELRSAISEYYDNLKMR